MREHLLSDSEFIFVDIIFSNNRRTTLGVFYRPPNYDVKPLEDLQAVLINLSTHELILLGDFNLNEIDWSRSRPLNNSVNYIMLIILFKTIF